MTEPTIYQIQFRSRVIVNTDPQRRCYNGVNFSEEKRWTEWTSFGRYSKEDGEESIKCFQSINPNNEYQLIPY